MKPDTIVIHCSDTEDGRGLNWPAIRRYHTQTNGWSDVGYHLGIERVDDDIEVLVGRPLDRQGAHCRAHGMNRRSIGVCFVGDWDDRPPPDDMLDTGARHVAGLCRVFGIPAYRIRGHREFDPGKTCPGAAFDMADFLRRVEREMEGD